MGLPNKYFIKDEVEQCDKLKRWFAPCERITDDGKILIQHKVRIRDIEKYPKQMPHFFTDIKRENFGFIGKQFVCFDYNSLIITKYWSLKRMQKATWV